MFAVGGANLGWMFALSALMVAERTTAVGRHLTRPIGAALVLWGLLALTGIVPFPSS
jgi:predicted metal-binding membrane protein